MRLTEFLEDNEGGLSTIRLATLVWVAGMVVVWAWVSFIKRELADVPNGVLGVLGILITGKTIQRFAENGPGRSGTGASALPGGSAVRALADLASAKKVTTMPLPPASPHPPPAPM